MELRVLRYFLAIAREGSITGAAEYLHLSQPTLTRQIKDLEEELGSQLFIRGNRNITLTKSGELLRKRAEEILILVERTSTEINYSDEQISGDIHIGGGETDVMRVIARIAKKLQSDYPNIHFHLFSGNADDVKERLDRGLLDFGILIEPTDTKKYNVIRLSDTDTWGLLMRKDNPLSKKNSITPKDLWSIPLIISNQLLVTDELFKWIGRSYEQLHVIATYNLIYNASLLVDEGMGYALCLDKLVNTGTNSNLCFIPLEPKVEANLDIVWKKYQIFSKASELFLKRIHQEL